MTCPSRVVKINRCVCDDGYLGGIPVHDGLVNLAYLWVQLTGVSFFLFSSPPPDRQILRPLSRTRLMVR